MSKVKTKEKKSGYFREVINEAKRVEWPTGSKLFNMTITVIIVCGLFALIFWIMDLIINAILAGMGI
ncbi:MAG: preprotein translocase subunit SecE [Bacilli bacterium]|jgi:preprotein translocase SecE subunit|nr:preprotein translocase subunit SecE [Bacilli bacterium]